MITKEESAQHIVTREELAEMLLISPHEVNSLWKNHGMPKESHGLYDLRKVVPFIIRRKNAQIEAEKHGDLTRADAEKQKIIFEMELVRIELAEKQKVTMNIEDVERFIVPTIIATQKKINSLPKEIQSTFPKDEPSQIRKAREEKIQRIIDETGEELSAIPTKLFGERPEKPKMKPAKKKPAKKKRKN